MTMLATATPMSERPFVTARAAAELLGVPEAAVVADVAAGNASGDFSRLNGGAAMGTVIVDAYELDGDRLAMHRARLAAP
jgi:hypothetical protein